MRGRLQLLRGEEIAAAPERIALARFGSALAPPLLAAAGMAVPVAVWRVAVLDRVPDAIFVISTIVIGVATVCIFLFGLMPGSLARLRTSLALSA